MDDMVKYLIGILIGVIIVGAGVMIFMHPGSDTTDDANGTIVDSVQENVDSLSNQVNSTVSNVANNGNSSANGNSGSLQSGQNGGVSGGEVSRNYQGDGGEMYQINYKDGNFRQYDTKTGELIGSTFDEDQEKLGVVDGNLE